ncbi:hypothetical protein B0H10DRAFT_2230786 [Mycena sp. CBHHK59/15]|nr:hypothetical protein B0H10DRAFT_2230786 [Mycena sp. CBHHK59/15]
MSSLRTHLLPLHFLHCSPISHFLPVPSPFLLSVVVPPFPTQPHCHSVTPSFVLVILLPVFSSLRLPLPSLSFHLAFLLPSPPIPVFPAGPCLPGAVMCFLHITSSSAPAPPAFLPLRPAHHAALLPPLPRFPLPASPIYSSFLVLSHSRCAPSSPSPLLPHPARSPSLLVVPLLYLCILIPVTLRSQSGHTPVSGNPEYLGMIRSSRIIGPMTL